MFNGRFSWWMAAVLVTVCIIITKPVTSQSARRKYTQVRKDCSTYPPLIEEFFLRNLNTTLSSLRRQLSNPHTYYAVARTVINGEPVYSLALCREYLSTADCVACFDSAVAGVKTCGVVNGGHVVYDDCDLRYERNNFFSQINVRGNVALCSNKTSSKAGFGETAERLLSDLGIATPRTPSFYAAASRRVTGSNVTLYALAQCNLNLTQSVCAECLTGRRDSLVDCLPNTYGRAIDAGCFMRYSGTSFFGVNQTTDILPFLKDGDSKRKKYIIGGVVGGFGILLFVFAFLLWHRRSRKSSRREKGRSIGGTELLQAPTTYTYNDLKIATKNFSVERKLGGGGFGEVYKGIMKDGDLVAIKRTSLASSRWKTSDSEITILSNVHHRHIIRLLGYCRKGPHLLLVLEFMENGSVDKFIFGEKRGSLNWNQRFDIIFGTARGLAYLHEQYHVTIIHRDIKLSNILLDNEHQPKIADFGLVRLLPEDKTHLSTKFAGTFGYVAPEYAMHGQLSEKVDTYSFGIVVLEIISGKQFSNNAENESAPQNMLDHAWNLYENGRYMDLIDVTLDCSNFVEEDAKNIIEIALMCTQSPVSARPSMSEVVTLLSDKAQEQRPAMRSALSNPDVKNKIVASTSTLASAASNATASSFEISGR